MTVTAVISGVVSPRLISTPTRLSGAGAAVTGSPAARVTTLTPRSLAASASATAGGRPTARTARGRSRPTAMVSCGVTFTASSNGACAARAARAAVGSALPSAAAMTTTGDVTNSAPANVAVSTSGAPSASTETAGDGARVSATGSRRVTLLMSLRALAVRGDSTGDTEHAAAVPPTIATLTAAATQRSTAVRGAAAMGRQGLKRAPFTTGIYSGLPHQTRK